MRKQLPTDVIANELSGASAFFQPQASPVTESPTSTEPVIPPPKPSTARVPVDPPASTRASKSIDKKASTLASYQRELVETIRRTVKKGGKEVSFVRLTRNEKDQLADIVYTYKRQGVKTTENEINRIAINFLLEDYKRNGETSVLASVIEALLA